MLANSTKELIHYLENNFSNNKPFVTYKKPNSTKIESMVQNNDSLELLNNFKQSGFIFSPFIQNNNTVLFEENNCVKKTFILNRDIPVELFSTSFTSVNSTKHIKLVSKGINKIENSELSKIVLSRVEKQVVNNYSFAKHFINLCLIYDKAFCYIWFHPKVGLWLGASPETLLKSNGFTFKTMSLAGTQQVKNNSEPIWEEKEIEEQQIVTNYIVSNLQKNNIDCTISETKTIKAGNLHHLQTEIKGKLNNALEQIVKILHPTPAVCGFPKKEALDFILENEGYDREFYTGYLGELNSSKSKLHNKKNIENHAYNRQSKETNLFVNLRSMKVIGNELHLFVGGGITAESNPEKEFIETVNKANTIKNSL